MKFHNNPADKGLMNLEQLISLPAHYPGQASIEVAAAALAVAV